jgi:hypothetical protein
MAADCPVCDFGRTNRTRSARQLPGFDRRISSQFSHQTGSSLPSRRGRLGHKIRANTPRLPPSTEPGKTIDLTLLRLAGVPGCQFAAVGRRKKIAMRQLWFLHGGGPQRQGSATTSLRNVLQLVSLAFALVVTAAWIGFLSYELFQLAD